MKRYALLDTDFISKTHSVQDGGGNHLIDRVMELPEYEFFCHAQIVTELNRYNADAPIWLSEKIGAQKIKSYTDQEILESLSLVRGPLACATYTQMLKLACDAFSRDYFSEHYRALEDADYVTISNEDYLKELQLLDIEVGKKNNLGEIKSFVLLQVLSVVLGEQIYVFCSDDKNARNTDYIQAQPGWVFVGIYADEGISGTSLEHRKGMQQLIEDCKAGKIDLVLTKSIARFARNIVDCLSVIELLKNLNPPVGVKFEADNIYTLDSNGRMILTILASVAEEESHSKSIIMNWSIDRRFSRGLFLTPALLGYDKDEEGNLVINPEEAQTVKVIYYLYLNGYSLTEIATLLMEYSRKTKLGRVEWNPGTLAGVLANERHCGDVLARKTFTPNFLTHKSKKNNNDRTQYRQKNHHEAIVSREVFNAANHLRASRNYSKKNRPLPVLSVVEDGILRGYVPFDKDWTGFSAEEYREASESVMKEPDATVAADVKKRLDLTGYEVVRAQYFSTMQNPAMTISNGRLRFNTACLKKFENVEYVELLLNSVERCIAIRPCNKNNPNAIRWGRLKEGRWCASTLGCRGLAKTLFDIMEWDEDLRYRFRGQFLEQGDNKMMLFAFDEPEMIKVEEIVLPPKENTEEDEGETVKKKIYIFPPEWAGTFGQPITSIAQVGILRQEHYAGNWDVFRPATEIEEMNIFTAESLNELLREAEKIMEGWTDYR